MLRITSKEWDKTVFQEFMDSLKGILDESVDISKACVIVHNIVCYTDEYLEKIDEKDASYLIGIWSELEEFPKDEKRLNYTTEELNTLD